MANVALVTFGSAGDLHPMLAIGQALRERGHRVALLTNPFFASTAAQAGIEFIPIGSLDDYRQTVAHPKLWHPIHGFGVMWRYLLRPALEPTCAALAELARGSGWLALASPVAMGARVAQERWGLKLVTTYTAATLLRTIEDPMTLAHWRMSPRVPAIVRRLAWRAVDRLKLEPLVKPALEALRHKLGLPALTQSVFGEWMHSPLRGAALFPSWFAPAARDWPAQVVQTGFPLYDADAKEGVSPALEAFVTSGPAPVVFMPGTAAASHGGFFESALRACARTGQRGLLLGRLDPAFAAALPAGIRAEPYVPFSWLLPRARALVHHGGVGSCAQAMRAAIPQLIAPAAYDQFDNAMRVERLGVGLSLGRGPAGLARMGERLEQLLASDAIAQGARRWSGEVGSAAARSALVTLVEQLDGR